MDHFVYIYAVFVLVVIGVLLILMLVMGLKNRQGVPTKPPAAKNHPAQEVLNRLGLEETDTSSARPKSPNLMKNTAGENADTPAPALTPATQASPEASPETIVITQTATDSPEFMELKAKHERLEALFQEKSQDLQKKEHELANELKIRKDFNKVKDLLEKEIKELKEKNHKLSLEISAAQMEVENQKKRSSQLEEKSNKKDKELLARENKINELTKQLVNFTGKMPAAGAAAPVQDGQPTQEKVPDNDAQPEDSQPLPPTTNQATSEQTAETTEPAIVLEPRPQDPSPEPENATPAVETTQEPLGTTPPIPPESETKPG